MKVKYLFIILIFGYSDLVAYDWELIHEAYKNYFEYSYVIDSLSFGVYGWTASGVPKFYVTSDGGATWDQTLTDEECFLDPEIRGGGLTPRAFSKSSKYKFYLSCDDGFILASRNQGRNWYRIKTNQYDDFVFFDMYNEKIGVTASNYSIYLTEDSCKTFDKINLIVFKDIITFIFHVTVPDSNLILFSAQSDKLMSNLLFRSTDRGKSWTYSKLPLSIGYNFNKINKDTIWAVSQTYIMIDNNYVIHNTIFLSSNGGITWSLKMKDIGVVEFRLVSISFLDKMHGIATGWGGLIYMTFDGGETWTKYNRIENRVIHEKINTGLRNSATTAFIFLSNGYIFKYDKIASNIKEIYNINKYLIYPNPTSDYINITLPENMYSNPTLKHGVDNVVENVQIFNMLGVEVINSVSYAATPQDGNVRIDVSHLPAGVYYVRIGDKVEKFVKM